MQDDSFVKGIDSIEKGYDNSYKNCQLNSDQVSYLLTLAKRDLDNPTHYRTADDERLYRLRYQGIIDRFTEAGFTDEIIIANIPQTIKTSLFKLQ